MPLKEPTSVQECVYFTNRTFDTGRIMVWVFRKICPKCNKEDMGKPKDMKGKVKIRAKEYVCAACKYMEPKEVYEPSLTANAKYKCPHCGAEGEGQISFKRKNIEGIPTLRFACEKCNGYIDVTKKMKEKKKGEGGISEFEKELSDL